MMTMVANRLFIDTNILIYANASDYVLQADAQVKLLHYEAIGYDFWINRQVIREYLSNMSKLMKSNNAYDSLALTNDVVDFENQFSIADENQDITDTLLMLIQKYNVIGKSIHDCNIVASMLSLGIPNILTHNVGDFTRYQAEGINVLPLISEV